MADGLIQVEFDYAAHEITAVDAKPLEKHAKVICETQDRVRRTTAEGILRIGKELAAARDRLANHGNGTFGKWCKERCRISNGSAYRAIDAYEKFNDLPTVGESFDATSLYLLSSDSCPEEAYDEAILRAEKGEPITAKVAREIIKQHSPQDDSDEADDEPVDDEPDSFDWQPADCILSLRKEVKRWLTVCPPHELHFIQETLRDIAAQLERRKDEQV